MQVHWCSTDPKQSRTARKKTTTKQACILLAPQRASQSFRAPGLVQMPKATSSRRALEKTPHGCLTNAEVHAPVDSQCPLKGKMLCSLEVRLMAMQGSCTSSAGGRRNGSTTCTRSTCRALSAHLTPAWPSPRASVRSRAAQVSASTASASLRAMSKSSSSTGKIRCDDVGRCG